MVVETKVCYKTIILQDHDTHVWRRVVLLNNRYLKNVHKYWNQFTKCIAIINVWQQVIWRSPRHMSHHAQATDW